MKKLEVDNRPLTKPRYDLKIWFDDGPIHFQFSYLDTMLDFLMQVEMHKTEDVSYEICKID